MNKKISTHKQNNVITVTNNNMKYYEDLVKRYTKEAEIFAVKAAASAGDAEKQLNSCKDVKDTLKQDVSQILDNHVKDYENPHNVDSEQVGAYSKTEVDNLLNTNLAKKNPKLVAGQNIQIVQNENGTQTISSENTIISDYSVFTNKPSINNVVLTGNKLPHDLGLASMSDIPTMVSELQNDNGYLTSHQDISGKQDVLSAGDGISITDNVVSTENRADMDLSNLSDIGKNVMDGQWKNSYSVLSEALSVNTYTIDLSDYLPNDNFAYEVLLNHYLTSTSTDGSSTYVKTNFYEDSIMLARASNGAGTRKSGVFAIVVPQDRILQYTIGIKSASSSTYLKAYAYRRIGTNQ